MKTNKTTIKVMGNNDNQMIVKKSIQQGLYKLKS